MGSFDGNYWKIYLNKEAQERRDEIKDHLEENFDGPSGFVSQALDDVDALSPREKLERIQQDKKEIERKEEQLKQVIEDRERQKKLREKRELLKQKQEELRKVSQESRSEEAIREEVREEEKERNHTQLSDEEWLEKNSERIERKVQNRLDEEIDVDQLVQEVQRLQDEISELAGTEEDFFMELEAVNGGRDE